MNDGPYLPCHEKTFLLISTDSAFWDEHSGLKVQSDNLLKAHLMLMERSHDLTRPH